MGLLGDFALGLAGVALDALTNDSNRNSNANNSGTRSDSGSTTILFDTDFPFSDVETRMEFVKLLLYRAAKILHVPLEENRGIFWDALFDDSLADDCISDFVVTNGSTTIRYGLFGMAQNALCVSGESVDSVMPDLISDLKAAGGVDIRRQKGEPQFHNADWLDETTESLYHENSNDDEVEAEDNESADDVDEFDGISEDDAVIALLGAFLGGNGEDVSEKDVQVAQAFFQNKFKEEFEAETVKETLLEFAGKFDERSYDMIEAIAENFDDGELNKLWYQLFVVCCAVFEARHSFFRAQFLIKTQEIFGISDEQSDFEAFFVAASRSLNISEDEISAFYTRVQNYASSKDEMKTRQEIAKHNWQHNIGVNYLERGDNDSLVFMQEFSSLLASDAANAEALNERLIEAAENGVSSAQSVLGYCYLTGKGIKKDELKALNLLHEAAEKGDLSACFPLGVILEKNGDAEGASDYYARAATEGDVRAFYRLGLAYENGNGVEKDMETAFYCYSEAKKLGNYEAMFRYGVFWFEGKGALADKNIGRENIQKAAKAGVTEAKEYLKALEAEKPQKSRLRK